MKAKGRGTIGHGLVHGSCGCVVEVMSIYSRDHGTTCTCSG